MKQPSLSKALPEALAQVHRRGTTGRLRVRLRDICRDIYLVNGEVRAAKSDVEEEMLGSWLVQRGLLEEQQKALLLLSLTRSNEPSLGHLVVKRGLLDRPTVDAELQAQTLCILERAASSTRATLELEEKSFEGVWDTIPDTTTPEVILLVARSYPDSARKRSFLGDGDRKVWQTETQETSAIDLGLNHEESLLLEHLDEPRPLARVLEDGEEGGRTAWTSLYGLSLAGLVELEAQPDERADSPGRRRATRRAASPGRADALDTSAALELIPGVQAPLEGQTDLTDTQRLERDQIRELANALPSTTHYEALELDRSASFHDIDAVYEDLCRTFDPARAEEHHLSGLQHSLRIIKDRLDAAYETLSDPSARKRYDYVLDCIQEGEEVVSQQERASKDKRKDDARRELFAANVQRAEELDKHGDTFGAVQLLQQAVDIDPQPEVMLRLARLLAKNPLWHRRALNTLRRALDDNPRLTEGWVELADFWRRQRDDERQRKALERALACDRSNARALEMYRLLAGPSELRQLLRRLDA